MKEVFKVSVNGKFTQYLQKSEVSLIRWQDGVIITLEPITVTNERYKILFGK